MLEEDSKVGSGAVSLRILTVVTRIKPKAVYVGFIVDTVALGTCGG
jgi:hypothetical protein